MRKKIKEFIKHNKRLSEGAIFSLIISIVYMASYNLNEWYPGLGKMFEFIYNLCLAYLGSFIFYIIQVYIPDKKKQQRLNTRIYRYLLTILCEASSIQGNINQLEDCIKEVEKARSENTLGIKNMIEVDKKLGQRVNHIMQYLNKTINQMDEYINKIRVTDREHLNELNISAQGWTELYVQTKINRREYHNGIVNSEVFYYKNILRIVKILQDICSIDELEKKLNMN